MKRYLLFSGDYYYPSGGAKDLDGSFDTLEQCIVEFYTQKAKCEARHTNQEDYWGHIFDAQTNRIIKKFGRID